MMRKAVWVRSFVVLGLLLAMGHACMAQIAVGFSVGFAPPELPVYEQPICPADGYLWTPGYWAWDPDANDYYWVPGTWVEPPEVGFFWTPPYWGWEGGHYLFHAGWWGPHIGFYGGINYGFGYFGHGYEGGRWEGGHFFYNTFVNHVNVTVIHNVYETRIDTREVSHVSFNGGTGGIQARATAEEEGWARERHVEATRVQTEHIQAARSNTQFRASVNHGRPAVAATARAGEFSGKEAVAARSGGNYNPPANRGGGGAESNRPPNAGHIKDAPPIQHMAAPNTGNAQRDQKFQQQQDQLYQKQNQERQNLQQKQEQEHQKAQQQNYNQAKQQQMEQRHQQQTQQLQQKHQQQQQNLQQRQTPKPKR